MKAIVHIGTEKTGTSSIQKYLYKNRRRLRGEGFHVLTSAGKGNNRALAAYCRSDSRPDDYFRDRGITTAEGRKAFRRELMKKLRKEINGLPSSIHTVLISSEHFHSRFRTDTEMNKFKKLLDEFFSEIKIICYIREQVATAESWYSTTLKAGGVDPLVEFMQSCRPLNYYYNYDDCLGAWEAIYGFDAMDVGIFSRERFVNGDLLGDFTQRLDPGLMGKLNTRVRVQNESLASEGQALARALNIAYPSTSTPPEIDRVVTRCKKMINRRLKGKGQSLDQESRMAIFDRFRESNERVRQRYFPDIDALFSPPQPNEPQPVFQGREFKSVLASVERQLRWLGGRLTALDRVEFSSALGTSVGDVVRGEATKTHRLQGKYLQLNDKDIQVLNICAERLQKQSDLSYKLTSMVAQVNPDDPEVQDRLKRYIRTNAKADTGNFMLLYRDTQDPVEEEALNTYRQDVANWMGNLRSPSGMPLCGVYRYTKFSPDGSVQEGEPPINAFSVITATSIDEARQIAAECPNRNVGGTIEVMEIFPFLAPPDE